MTPKTNHKIEVKNIKHAYTDVELNELGASLARAIGTLRGIENEFDQVKSSYKAKTSEAEAKIDSLSTSRVNGFEMRNEKCVVVFRPKQREKDFYLETEFDDKDGKAVVLLTESMTYEDYALELFQAESVFDLRAELEIFKPIGDDNGKLIVGKFGKLWYQALRVKIGKLELNERLDSEQKGFKERADAIESATKRFTDWSTKNFKDQEKGFQDGLKSLIEANKELAE